MILAIAMVIVVWGVGFGALALYFRRERQEQCRRFLAALDAMKEPPLGWHAYLERTGHE